MNHMNSDGKMFGKIWLVGVEWYELKTKGDEEVRPDLGQIGVLV